jgi:superoxide oxidase
MITNLETAEKIVAQAPLRSERFDPTSIMLHWLTVLFIVGQFTTIWLHEFVGHETALGSTILDAHRTMGVLTWAVVSARLIWRRRFAYLPPFPQSMPKLQQWIAKANEYGLYALLLVQPITGLGEVLFHGRSFALFIWEVPALFEPDPSIRFIREGSRSRRPCAPHPHRSAYRRRAFPWLRFARRRTATDASAICHPASYPC